jgi:DnaJ-class molecular chaperone
MTRCGNSRFGYRIADLEAEYLAAHPKSARFCYACNGSGKQQYSDTIPCKVCKGTGKTASQSGEKSKP